MKHNRGIMFCFVSYFVSSRLVLRYAQKLSSRYACRLVFPTHKNANVTVHKKLFVEYSAHVAVAVHTNNYEYSDPHKRAPSRKPSWRAKQEFKM